MKIKFKNGSTIESIPSDGVKRGKRCDEVLRHNTEVLFQYYEKNPDKFVEEFFGVDLLDSQKSFFKTLWDRK